MATKDNLEALTANTLAKSAVVNSNTEILADAIDDVSARFIDMQEPTGFIAQNDSINVWSEGSSPSFGISPTGANFEYYIKNVKYTVTGTITATLSSSIASGFYYFYLDSNKTMQYSNAETDVVYRDGVLCAVGYWNGSSKKWIYRGKKRHTISINWKQYKHSYDTVGITYKSGFDVLGLNMADTVATTPTSVRQNQFVIDAGVIADVDYLINIPKQGNESTSNFTATSFPLFHKEGFEWVKEPASNYGVIGTANNRVNYNSISGTGSTQQQVPVDNAYVLCHIFATNDETMPIAGVQGVKYYTSLADAREGAQTELYSLNDTQLPMRDFRPLTTLIYQTAVSSVWNACNNIKLIPATTTANSVVDWRATKIESKYKISSTAHASITGRSEPNQHPASAIKYNNTDVGTYLDNMGKMVNVINNGPIDASGNANVLNLSVQNSVFTKPWNNPSMVSASQDGYTATAEVYGNCIPYLNFRDFSNTDSPHVVNSIYATYGQRPKMSLNFPADKNIFVNTIYFPVNGGSLGYGYPNTNDWTLNIYKGGNIVKVVSGHCGTVLSIDAIACDRIQIDSYGGSNPDWCDWSPFKFTGYEVVTAPQQVPFATPMMTSTSQDGFTTNVPQLFNPTSSVQWWNGQTGTLYFPIGTSAYINKIYVPPRTAAQPNTYYDSTGFTMILYYKGTEMYRASYAIPDTVGIYYSIPTVQTDQIFNSHGWGAPWDNDGDGSEDCQAGKQYFGYTIADVASSGATADLWTDFRRFDATDNYGSYQATVYGAPTFTNGRFNSNGVTGINYNINTVGTGAWCIQGKFKFNDITSQMRLVQANNTFAPIVLERGIDNKLAIYLSSNNTAYDLASALKGTKANFDTITEYYIRIRFTLSQYLVDWSTDGINWTNDITVNSIVKVYGTFNKVGFGFDSASTLPLIGYMDEIRMTCGASVIVPKDLYTTLQFTNTSPLTTTNHDHEQAIIYTVKDVKMPENVINSTNQLVINSDGTSEAFPLTNAGNDSILDLTTGNPIDLYNADAVLSFSGTGTSVADGWFNHPINVAVGGNSVSITKDLNWFNQDFTIECFAVPYSFATNQVLFGNWTTQAGNPLVIWINTAGKVCINLSSAPTSTVDIANGTVGATALTLNTQFHIAVVRERLKGTYRVYVNGVLDQTVSSYADVYPYMAGLYMGEMQGKSRDLRLTVGVARYTTNFTPPAIGSFVPDRYCAIQTSTSLTSKYLWDNCIVQNNAVEPVKQYKKTPINPALFCVNSGNLTNGVPDLLKYTGTTTTLKPMAQNLLMNFNASLTGDAYGNTVSVLGNGAKSGYDVSSSTFTTGNSYTVSKCTAGNLNGVFYSGDGMIMYASDKSTSIIYQYNLTAPWAINTSTTTTKSFNASTQISAGNLYDAFLSSDGTKLYGTHLATKAVYQYNLTVAWDISSAVYSGASYICNEISANYFADVFFSAEGSFMYATDASTKTIYQYKLVVAWDISTASFTNIASNKFVATQITTNYFYDLYITPDGYAMYAVDTATGIIYQYGLSTAWSIGTASYTGRSFTTTTQIVAGKLRGIYVSLDGSKLYATDCNTLVAYQYNLATGKYVSGNKTGLKCTSITTLGTDVWTMEGRFKTSSLSAVQTLMCTSGWGVNLVLGVNGKLYLNLSSNNTSWNISTGTIGTATLVVGTEYHIALVFDGTAYKLYVNGALDATVTSTMKVYNTFTSLYFGALNDAVDSPLTGTIDDVRVSVGLARYTTAFTAPAVDTLLIEYITGGALTTLSTKTGTGYNNALATTLKGSKYTISNSLTLNMSGYVDNIYNVFLKDGTSLEAYTQANYGSDLYVDFSQGNATDNYGYYTPVTVGTPTYTNNKYNSGATSSGLYYPMTIPNWGKWCVQGKFKFNSSTVAYNLFACYTAAVFGFALDRLVTTNKLGLYLSNTANTTWTISAGTGAGLGIKADWDTTTEYYIRARFTGVQYLVDWSLDGVNWTNDIALTSSTPVNCAYSPIYFGTNQALTGNTGWLQGTMDELQATIGDSTCLRRNKYWRQYTQPQTPLVNDVWYNLAFSTDNATFKKFNGTSWEDYNAIPIGNVSVANGLITGVSTKPYYTANYPVANSTWVEHKKMLCGTCTTNASGIISAVTQPSFNVNNYLVTKNTKGAYCRSWTSKDFPIATGTAINITHNLGIDPANAICIPMLICKVPSDGFSAGDMVQGPFMSYGSTEAPMGSPILYSNSVYQPVGATRGFYVSNKTGTAGIPAASIPAYWNYRVRIIY